MCVHGGMVWSGGSPDRILASLFQFLEWPSISYVSDPGYLKDLEFATLGMEGSLVPMGKGCWAKESVSLLGNQGRKCQVSDPGCNEIGSLGSKTRNPK